MTWKQEFWSIQKVSLYLQSKKRVNSYQATVLRGAVVEIKSFSLNFPMSHVVTEHVNVNPLEDCGTMKAYQSRGMPSFFYPPQITQNVSSQVGTQRAA